MSFTPRTVGLGKEGLSLNVTQALSKWRWFFHNCLQMCVYTSLFRELRGLQELDMPPQGFSRDLIRFLDFAPV